MVAVSGDTPTAFRLVGLPTELLGLVILAALYTTHDREHLLRLRLNLQLVCHKWHTICINTPEVWALLHLLRYSHEPDMRIIRKSLNLSRNTPLNIRSRHDGLHHLSDHELGRAGTLLIYDTSPTSLEDLGCRIARHSANDLLTDLTILADRSFAIYIPQGRVPVQLASVAPRLRVLKLTQCYTNLDMLGNLSFLQDLTLTRCIGSGSNLLKPGGLFLLLQNCPRIRRLEYDNAQCFSDPRCYLAAATTRFSAHSVEELTLKSLDFLSVSMILAGVHFPSLTTMKVAFAEDFTQVPDNDLVLFWKNSMVEFNRVTHLDVSVKTITPSYMDQFFSKFPSVRELSFAVPSYSEPLNFLHLPLSPALQAFTTRGVSLISMLLMLQGQTLPALEILNMDQASARNMSDLGKGRSTNSALGPTPADGCPRCPCCLLDKLKMMVKNLNLYRNDLSDRICYEGQKSFEAWLTAME